MEISVIIPTYFPQKYIKDCLDSLERQSLGKDKFEVCIILNGAAEQSEEYLSLLMDNYTFQYKLLITETGGVSNARNIGIENTSSKYICFIDDDDCVSESYLEQLLLNSEGIGTIVVSNVMSFIDNIYEAKANDYISNAFAIAQRKYPNNIIPNVLKGRKFMSSSCCKIISRDDISTIRFDKNLHIGEDAFFMAGISHNINRIILAPSDVIYYRRLSAGSASRTPLRVSQKKKIASLLIKRYIKLLSGSYNRIFIFTRIAATIRNIFL